MANSVDAGLDAARAAMEAAKRAAEEAARRAAEASRRAAEAQAKQAAQAAQAAQTKAATANTVATKRPALGDDFDTRPSSPKADALRLGQQAPVYAQDDSTQKLNSVAPTSLLTEDVHDDAENCLDASIEKAANTNGQVVLLDPRASSPLAGNAGHAIVKNDQGYWDPKTPDVTYPTFQAWKSASSDPSNPAAPSNASLYQLTELGTDQKTGAPVGISGQSLYDLTSTEDPSLRASKVQALSQQLGVPPSFFGEGHQYASGGPITIPPNTPTTTFPSDPPGVRRVDVASLGEPLRSQLNAASTIQANTGAGSGVNMASQGGNLYVAVDAQGQLLDLQNGQPSVFHTGTVNTLSIFAGVDMANPKAVSGAFADALKLTQGGRTQPLDTTKPLTPEQVQAYQQMGYTVAVLDPSNGRAAVRPPGSTDQDIANIGNAAGNSTPVYVLVGGPDVPGIGQLPPERVAQIQKQAADIRAQNGGYPTTADPYYASNFGLSAQSSPAEWAVYAQAIVKNFPPQSPSTAESSMPLKVMANDVEAQGSNPARLAVANVLAQQALSPSASTPGSDPGIVAATAMRLVNTPQDATAFLEGLGPQRATALLDKVGLGFGQGTTQDISADDRTSLAYGGLEHFVGLLAHQPPSPARDAFNQALLSPQYQWSEGGPEKNAIYQGAVQAWAGRMMAMPAGPDKLAAAQACFAGGPPELWSVPGFSQSMASTVAPAMYPGDPAKQAALQAQLASATNPADFLAPIAQIGSSGGAPNVGQANFLFGVAHDAGPDLWKDPKFAGEMGAGLANVFALGNPQLAAQQGGRLSSLFANPAMGQVLAAATPQQREQILVAALNTPTLTSELLDAHHGNLGTAITEAQYVSFTQTSTADLMGGQPRLGPDGKPLLSDRPLPPLPAVPGMENNPVSKLPQPLTTQSIQQAVAAGTITGPDAAAYLRAMAHVTDPVAKADMEAFGSSPALTNVIGFLQDFNPFNDPNPIRASRADQMAIAQQNALLGLADKLDHATDPAFVAQALGAGLGVNAGYWGSMQPFGQALQGIEGDVQRNRVITMVAVGTVASILAPIGIAEGLPALGEAGTIFGMGVTGSPFLSAALPAAATGVMGTTTNAAMQYEEHGTVNWGNAILAGSANGLTAFFGGMVAAKGMAEGWGLARTVVTSGSIDAAGGFGSYVLGTPGALDAIMHGDQQQLFAALGQAGMSFAISAGVNGVMYRVNLGNAPPLAESTDYEGNQALVGKLLDPANPAGAFGTEAGRPQVFDMNGQPLTASGLQGRDYESYFAVYKNPSTGEIRIQEVAQARPGDPMHLAAFDTVQGIRRNNPGAGWEPVGGFHNHPGMTGAPSPEDLAMEPIFRGEFGDGFNSFTVGTDGALPFHNGEQPPLTLREAFESGYEVPGLSGNVDQVKVFGIRNGTSDVSGAPTMDEVFASVGPNNKYLTPEEMAKIQAQVDQVGEPLLLGGSRGNGNGRNVGTSATWGKGADGQSDFDFYAFPKTRSGILVGEGDSAWYTRSISPDLNPNAQGLADIWGSSNHVDMNYGIPQPGPQGFVLFRPGQEPVLLWPGYFEGAPRPANWP